MNHLLLQFLHVAGVIGLFTALGGVILGSSGRKGASILHGISLLLIFVAGCAMIHNLGKAALSQYYWMLKMVLWLFIGAAPGLAKRKVLPAPALLALCLAAGLASAYLGFYKPF